MENIEARQVALAQKLFLMKDSEILKYLEQIFKEIEQERLTKEELEGIEEAMVQVKNKEYVSLEAAKERHKKWLK